MVLRSVLLLLALQSGSSPALVFGTPNSVRPGLLKADGRAQLHPHQHEDGGGRVGSKHEGGRSRWTSGDFVADLSGEALQLQIQLNSSGAAINYCTESELARRVGLAGLQAQKASYWRDGFLVVPNLFSPAEAGILKEKIVSIGHINKTVLPGLQKTLRRGEHSSFSTVFGWNKVDPAQGGPRDIFSKLSSSDRILDRLSCFYDDEVYGFHNKIILKYPGYPGFRPHQDQGYWMKTGSRFPETSAVYVAIDPSTEANGALNVVRRSHLLGTYENVQWSESIADSGMPRESWTALLNKGYRPESFPMQPGDAIFFSGNTIHLSGDNLSPISRLAIIATMNTRGNSVDPKKNALGYACYTGHPLERVYDPITRADLALELPDWSSVSDPACKLGNAVPEGHAWVTVRGVLQLIRIEDLPGARTTEAKS